LRICLFLIVLAFAALPAFSQTPNWDTTYYRKYRDRLVVSVFQSVRTYGMDITQKLNQDTSGQSKVTYRAEANNITGIELNYDKLNVAFGFKSTPPQNQVSKGNTKYTNLALNVGGNRWILENSYRSYTGFYNNNTLLYDTTFKTEGKYTQLPSLKSEAYKTKFLFFTNANKFSFKSGYSCSQRQLKSAFSFVLTANIYYNRLNSDSSFIPLPVRHYYDDYGNVHGLNVFAFSVYGGGSFNLVLWKAFFLNLTLIIGPEEQWRTYHYLNESPKHLFYTSISGDFRSSIGLNFKKFFIMATSTSDFSYYNSNVMEYFSKYGAVNFSIGYRFHMKTPKSYSRFQQTKLYRIL